MTDDYNDIIHLQRHVSKTRSPMPIINRAAQFSPFAALTGYDTAIKETARITEKRIELDQYVKEALNYKLHILIGRFKERPEIKVTYFQPDENKDGGIYMVATGTLKKIDEYEKVILMDDGMVIPIDEIINIEGEIFKAMG